MSEDTLSIRDQLNLATGDVIVLLRELNTLLAEGGEVEQAVQAALASFGPLFAAMRMDLPAAAEFEEAAPMPQAGPSSGRPPAQVASEDQPNGAKASASPKLTHHSFRGDSSIESQGDNSAVAGSKRGPKAMGLSEQPSTTRPQPSGETGKVTSSDVEAALAQIVAMKKVFSGTNPWIVSKQPKSVTESRPDESAENEPRDKVEEAGKSQRVSLGREDSAVFSRRAPIAGSKARRGIKRPSAVRPQMEKQRVASEPAVEAEPGSDVPSNSESSDKMEDSSGSAAFSPYSEDSIGLRRSTPIAGPKARRGGKLPKMSQ